MIKVLNIISDTNIGGAGRVLLNYMQSTDRANFDTAVVRRRPPGQPAEGPAGGAEHHGV